MSGSAADPLEGQAGGGEGLGGVLGDVVRHRLVVQRLASAGQVVAVNGAEVGALRGAEGQRERLAAVLDRQGDERGGLADGLAQQRGVIRGGRGLVTLPYGVQADHGVEVDDAAGLVLGDLDEPDAHPAAQGLLGDPGQAGQAAEQVGDEPAPRVTCVRVEQHRGFVVVAVGAHGLTQAGIGLDVAGGAGDVAAVRAAAGLGVAAGSAGQHGLAANPAGVDRAERRGGEGGEHARVAGDRLRDALTPGEARADELAGVLCITPLWAVQPMGPNLASSAPAGRGFVKP
jgi:hypothetical protein